MFSLSNKYRVPSNFKNQLVSIWYDGKSAVANHMSKLKLFVQEKANSVMARALQPGQPEATSATEALGDQLSQSNLGKEEYAQLIERFELDMVELKKGTKEFQNTLNAMQARLKASDENIKLD